MDSHPILLCHSKLYNICVRLVPASHVRGGGGLELINIAEFPWHEEYNKVKVRGSGAYNLI